MPESLRLVNNTMLSITDSNSKKKQTFCSYLNSAADFLEAFMICLARRLIFMVRSMLASGVGCVILPFYVEPVVWARGLGAGGGSLSVGCVTV